MSSQRFALGAILAISIVAPLRAQTDLPPPTGKYSVGRTSVLWFDGARSNRPVRVDFWYPAESGKELLSPYLPGLDDLLKSPTIRRSIEHKYGPHYARLRIGALRANAREDALVAHSGRPFPLVLFSHGLGAFPYDYTMQLEDLASHGYVIAAPEHIHDAFAVRLKGSVVPFDSALWAQHTAILGSTDFQESRAQLCAEDMIFVLNQLSVVPGRLYLFSDDAIDFKLVGAFGHSSGGRSAAAACILNERLKACMNQDGRMSATPYWPIAGHRLRGVFAMLDWFNSGLEEDDFAGMHITPEQYARSKLQAEGAMLDAYTNVSNGSYHLTMLQPGMLHTAFTDLPWLTADSEADRARYLQYLATIRLIVREFFDQSLKGAPSGLLMNCGSAKGEVLVQCYKPL